LDFGSFVKTEARETDRNPRLKPQPSSIQLGVRPAVIIQNDIGNLYSPTTIVAPLTGKNKKQCLPTHVLVRLDEMYDMNPNAGITMTDSILLFEQIRVIDVSMLLSYIGRIDINQYQFRKALAISFGLEMLLKESEVGKGRSIGLKNGIKR